MTAIQKQTIHDNIFSFPIKQMLLKFLNLSKEDTSFQLVDYVTYGQSCQHDSSAGEASRIMVPQGVAT